MATVHLRPMATGSRLTLLTCLLLLLLLVATSITCVAAAEESERLDIVHAMSLSYYELLGIPTTATAKEIKKASANTNTTATMPPTLPSSSITHH